jgi:hypothetical protein
VARVGASRSHTGAFPSKITPSASLRSDGPQRPETGHLVAGSGRLTVRNDFDASVTQLTLRGDWDEVLHSTTPHILRGCIAEHPRTVLVDLTALSDPAAASIPTWYTAARSATTRHPPTALVLCAAPRPVRQQLNGTGIHTADSLADARSTLPAVTWTHRRRLPLPGDRHAAGAARRMAADACQAWGLPPADHACPARHLRTGRQRRRARRHRPGGRSLPTRPRTAPGSARLHPHPAPPRPRPARRHHRTPWARPTPDPPSVHRLGSPAHHHRQSGLGHPRPRRGNTRLSTPPEPSARGREVGLLGVATMAVSSDRAAPT